MTMTERRRAEGLPTPNDEIALRTATFCRRWLGVMWWGIIDNCIDPIATERLLELVVPTVDLDR